MLGSVVLDLAIGMAFIYLLLSLIASVLQEMLASLVQSRSAVLQRGLHSLFSGDSVDPGTTLVDSIYDHGLIRGLYQDPKNDYAAWKLQDTLTNPQNPPANHDPSGEAWELSLWSQFRLWVQHRVGIAPFWRLKTVSDPMLLPSYIPPRTFALALIDILNKEKSNGQPLQNIRKLLADTLLAHPENKAAEALMALATDAKGDLAKFQKNLENWFNDSMDRASGWYKKHTQELLFFIGLAIAVALNVDSVRVAETLWVDRDARQGMVTAAGDYLQRHQAPAPAPTPAAQQSDTQNPIDQALAASTPATQAPASTEKENARGLLTSMQTSVQAFHEVANATLLPVGWRHSPRWYWRAVQLNFRASLMRGIICVFGWLITAAALSLGAPFWFDTLSKFMTVRSTVKPQDPAQTPDS